MCAMKRLMAMTLCGVMGCVAMAQAIPEKIYVSRYSSEKRVEVVGGMYVDSMKMTLGNVKLYDSLYFHMTDGTTRGFRVRGIDSITMDEPRDLLLKELDYYNKISNKRIPTYSDSYVNIASWTQRSQWNLANVHDPTVMKAADGYYYMYQTDASYGNSHVGHGHFHGRRSRDLVNWEYLGGTLMDDQPQWALDSVNAYFSRMGRAKVNKLTDMGYWAPVVRKINDNLYRMYYCLVPSEWAFIGMMETTDPASNKWEDKGFVISSSSDKSASAYGTGSQWGGWFCFNAIDPTYEVTPDGKHWLIYGSWHTGIAAVEINPETGKLMESPGNPWNIGSTSPGATTRYGKRVYTRKAGDRWQASEGPEVIYNPETGYYYMFLAYDELAVAYNTRVCRARNITGPYYGMDGTDVTNGGDCYPVVTHPYKFDPQVVADSISGWVGIAHCGVFNDGEGNWYYTSQGRLPEGARGNAYSNAIMHGHVRRILWTESGWPVVLPERYAAVPQPSITADELVGDWEHILLQYSYQKQRTSATLTLKEDGSISGAMSGRWSFDPNTNTLRLGAYKLCVARELDWEASPRKTTIVYAGYSSDGKRTFWGKKK